SSIRSSFPARRPQHSNGNTSRACPIIPFSTWSVIFIDTSNLGLELHPVSELIQRFGVGERLLVLDLPSVHDVPHRKLDDLSALGSRNLRDLQDPGRHMPW